MFSQKFFFPFNSNKFKLLSRSISRECAIHFYKLVIIIYGKLLQEANKPIVKEELFSRMDKSFSKNTNPMIAVDHHDFCVAVRIDGVIGESDFVTLSSSVDHEI
jgi:hypothetical protein